MSNSVTQKVQDFFAGYRLQTVEKGKLLIRSGSDPDGVYFLVQGEVRQFDIAANGDEIVVNVFKSSSFFPMSWAINGTPNRYFFGAYTDLKVRKAPAKAVVDFLHEHPDVAFDLLSRVYKGIDGLLNRMVFLMQNSARNRVLFELWLSSQRFGVRNPDNSYRLEVTESEIATRSGLTRETVSREMRVIKQQGLVKMMPGGVIVNNLDELGRELQLDAR
jgi:CRP-like cAMP-binding protein